LIKPSSLRAAPGPAQLSRKQLLATIEQIRSLRLYP
jgi:hypothetical protein